MYWRLGCFYIVGVDVYYRLLITDINITSSAHDIIYDFCDFFISRASETAIITRALFMWCFSWFTIKDIRVYLIARLQYALRKPWSVLLLVSRRHATIPLRNVYFGLKALYML